MSGSRASGKDNGRGWRSPRVALVREELDEDLEARRSRRSFLRGASAVGTVLGLGAASAVAGALVSRDGRTAITELVEAITPDGVLGSKQSAMAGNSSRGSSQVLEASTPTIPTPVGLLPTPSFPGLEMKEFMARGRDKNGDAIAEADGQAASAKGNEDDTLRNALSDASNAAKGEAGFEDTRAGSSGGGSGKGNGGENSVLDQSSESETDERSEAISADTDNGQVVDPAGVSGDSSPGGVVDPYSTPVSDATPEVRVVNPYGSDSTAPELGSDRSVVTPRIPNYNLPHNARVLISALGVDALVVPLGMDAQGRMLAPNGPNHVGWFELGPLPGTSGNAILTGHIDWADGSLGVFSSLKALQHGQLVQFSNPETGFADYLVKWHRTYLASQAPISEILGQNMQARELTLITCAGTFDMKERNYSHRLIVRCGME